MEDDTPRPTDFPDLQEFLGKLDDSLRIVNDNQGFAQADNEILRAYFIKSVESCLDSYPTVFEMK